MNRKEVEEKVTELVAKQINVNVEDVVPTLDFINDLGFDSLDAVEIVMGIEDEFGLNISEEDADRLVTVNLTTDYILKSIEEE